MHECMALFTWTHVYFYYFLYILLFISIFCVCYLRLVFMHVLLQALTVRSPLVSCVCE